MRVLFGFAGGRGHLEPLRVLARAARDAGHEVAFSGRPWMGSHVEALGYQFLAAGPDEGLTPTRMPLRRRAVEDEERNFVAGFVGRIATERAPVLIERCRAWAPDVILWEESDFAAPVVAERLGIPHAAHRVLAAGALARRDYLSEPLDRLRAAHGLDADPELAMLDRHLTLSPFPPSFRDPAIPPPPTEYAYRMGTPTEIPGRADWLPRGDGPLIYFTLGTIFNVEAGDLYRRVLAGLRKGAARAVVTVGRELDPAELGIQPDRIHVTTFVPQAELLPHVDAVVSHGGSGTVLGTLAHGVPQIVLAMGADQPHNAVRVETLGLGLALDPHTVTPDEIADAVERILTEPAFRRAAARVRAEIASLPGAEGALERIERLAAERRPIDGGHHD